MTIEDLTIEDLTVRPLQPDENLEPIRDLLFATKQRNYNDLRLDVVSADELKEAYLTGEGAGFVAEQEGKIVGFMGVVMPDLTRNGLLEYAVTEEDSLVMERLVGACAEVVRKCGGDKLYYFATTSFGQVSNRQIRFLEQLGFISDEFSHVSAHLSLNDWTPEEGFDPMGIVPNGSMDTADVHRMLVEDGEEQQAALFMNQYPNSQPNVVLLTLQHDEQPPFALAYYKVSPIDSQDPALYATAFGLHFRQSSDVRKDVKRRMIQAALMSMKQLQVTDVVSILTLKSFDTFALLVRAGFDDFLANSLRLVKRI